MSCRILLASLASLVPAAACTGGESVSPPRSSLVTGFAGEARVTVTDVVTCARAPMSDFTGTAIMKDGGGTSTWSSTRADIRWVLESTERCVDRYRPTGTVSFIFVEPCNSRVVPETVVVGPTDGVLTIDRTAAPLTYEIRGATTWEASITCAGARPEPAYTVGGPWALAHGTFDGESLSGSFHAPAAGAWSFTHLPPAVAVSSPGQ